MANIKKGPNSGKKFFSSSGAGAARYAATEEDRKRIRSSIQGQTAGKKAKVDVRGIGGYYAAKGGTAKVSKKGRGKK